MKRDPDLARQLLLAIEENPEATGANTFEVDLAGHDKPEVDDHVRLLVSAGLIEATKGFSVVGGERFAPRCLTYAGHPFLDAARNDTLWQKAKSITLEKTGGLAFEVRKSVVLHLAKDAAFRGVS